MIKIVVLQRGWVIIGRFSQTGSQCLLQDASVIRVWGTEKGLGQLFNGPTGQTKLDKCHGDVQFHELTVVFTLAVNQDAWKGIIA